MRTQQSSRSCNFSGLFELRVEPCDHSYGRYEADSTELLTDSFSINMESLNDPIPCCDRILHSMRDDAALRLHQMLDLNNSLILMFYEEFVEFFSQLVVKHLEAVLKHQL